MNAEYVKYFATNIYTDSTRNVCEVKPGFLQALAATLNQQVIAAVSGKRIRILRGTVHSNGAAGSVVFYSSTGGAACYALYIPANTVATPNVPIEWSPDGAFESITSGGIFVDNNSAATVNISLRYIEVTP